MKPSLNITVGHDLSLLDSNNSQCICNWEHGALYVCCISASLVNSKLLQTPSLEFWTENIQRFIKRMRKLIVSCFHGFHWNYKHFGGIPFCIKRTSLKKFKMKIFHSITINLLITVDFKLHFVSTWGTRKYILLIFQYVTTQIFLSSTMIYLK
jgi:hypothetical protein